MVHSGAANRTAVSRRRILRTTAGLGALGMVGASGLRGVSGRAAAIETCGTTLDVVLVLDYSGSIRSAGTWNDIRDGATDFVDELADDNQVGLVTFGDTAKAYDFDSDDYLVSAQDGATDNRGTVKSAIPTTEPPQENGTHMPGALALANDILDEQGRGGKEAIILLTDGSPNYENGIIGDGAAPPSDDADGTVGDISGWLPNGSGGFDPDGDATDDTYDFTGGKSGGEDAVITDSERNETAEIAAMARGDSQYTKMDGTTVSVSPSPPTRLLTVGIGGADQTYLASKIASSPGDHIQTTAENIGTELVGLLEDLCEPECVVDLYAGQTIPSGTVSFSLAGDILTVTYTTSGDWRLQETHLDVVGDFCDFPTAGNDNPKVGQFAYSETHDDVTTYTYEVDVSGLEGVPPYLVAAHAVVDDGEREETAWADGCPFTERGNWATFAVFDPESNTCDCPADYEKPSCDDAGGKPEDDEGSGGKGKGGKKGKGRGNGKGNGKGSSNGKGRGNDKGNRKGSSNGKGRGNDKGNRKGSSNGKGRGR
jgi:hypothetical protein